MKFKVLIPRCFRYTVWYKEEIRDDGYSQEYLDFIKNSKDAFKMTGKEVELLKLLVDNKYGRLDQIIKFYKQNV